MDFRKITIFLIALFYYIAAFAQSSSEYEIVYPGPYKDKFELSSHKQWYLVAKGENEYKQACDYIIKVDPVKGLKWVQDKKLDTYSFEIKGVKKKLEAR